MAGYTKQQYADQRRTMAIINRANQEGRCPICGKPQGVWPSGSRRMTCDDNTCHDRWLRVRPGGTLKTLERGS